VHLNDLPSRGRTEPGRVKQMRIPGRPRLGTIVYAVSPVGRPVGLGLAAGVWFQCLGTGSYLV
jgi:hypothetical protein